MSEQPDYSKASLCGDCGLSFGSGQWIEASVGATVNGPRRRYCKRCLFEGIRNVSWAGLLQTPPGNRRTQKMYAAVESARVARDAAFEAVREMLSLDVAIAEFESRQAELEAAKR